MLFKVLKLAGIDVNTKLAELKADHEVKAQQVSEHASYKARNFALIAGLFLCASIFALFAIIVGLIALYHWTELRYGPNTGLALVAGTLLVLAALCAGVALAYANSRSDDLTLRRIALSWPPRRAQSIPLSSVTGASARVDSASLYQAPPFKGEDLVEPLLVLLGPYLRFPATGHPAIDNMLGQMGTKAEGTTNEAVGRAADLVRNGNRTTMLSVLGAATLFGWFIARGASHSHSHRPA
jgi:hypothetical protein